MDYKPERLAYWAEECSKAAKEYAEYVHQEKLFQVLSSAKLAALVMMYKTVNPSESYVSLETRAKSSEDWRIFTNEQLTVLKEAGRKWIHYEDCKRQLETEQSIAAFKREEFKHIG
jgi:hypothetical protein